MSTSDNRHILQAALTHFGDPGVEPEIASVRAFYHAFWSAFPDVAIAADDTGKRIEFSGITILQFRKSRCVERWSQADFLSVLQQIGAIPAP